MLSILILIIAVAFVLFFFLKGRTGTSSHSFEFNGRTYKVSTRRYNLIQKAMQGDEKAQYEIITEYYEVGRSKQFIPELCFYYTYHLAQQERDLGVLTELGDLYFNGIGTDLDTGKAAALYRRALQLFDNPTPGLYIPEKSAGYRKFLQETLQQYEGEK